MIPAPTQQRENGRLSGGLCRRADLKLLKDKHQDEDKAETAEPSGYGKHSPVVLDAVSTYQGTRQI